MKSILYSMLIFVIVLFCFYNSSYASFNNLKNEIKQIETELNNEANMEPECLDLNINNNNQLYNNKSKKNNYSRGEGRKILGPYKGLTYYSQADSRWANTIYTSSNNYSQTMKSSGCGPTAASIVVSSSIGEILPPTMAQLFVNNGFRTLNNGTSWQAFPFVANYFAFNNYEFTQNINTAIDYLRKGYYIIASCGEGLFTVNGHFIVLAGIQNNTLSIYDTYMYEGKFDIPSRKDKVQISGNTIYCTINNFINYSNYKAFWCYSNNHKNESSSYNTSANNVTDKYTLGTYQVTASVLRVRMGPGTNYKISARIKKGSKQKIDRVKGNWGHLSNNSGWICLDYCKKIASQSSSSNKYSAGIYQVATKSFPLRIRKGPGTNYRIVGSYKKGTKIRINYVRGNWGHLTNGKGWIYLGYCKKIS